MTGPQWGVRVDEVRVFATRQGDGWWSQALARWEGTGRAVCLDLCPAGGIWWLPGGGKDDAEFMRDHITNHGVNPKFVTITTRAQAEAERTRRHAGRAGT